MPSQLDKAKTKLVIAEPFYATIILSLKPHLVTNANPMFGGQEVKTLATNGTDLVVNTDFFDALPLSRAITALKHEALHVALMHPFRRGTRTPQRWNQSGDYVINDKLKNEGGDLGEGWLLSSAFSNMSTEQVYAQLPPEPPGGGSGGSGGQGQGSGDGQPNPDKNSNPSDDVLEAPDKSEAAEAQARATVNKAINVAKAMGKMPGDLKEMLDDILNPKVDWRDVLRRFMTEANKSDYSFARPNRRMISQGYYLPTRHGMDAMREIAVVIDTSGSMGDEELKQMFGEVCGAVEECCPGKVTVVYCDAGVNHVDQFEDTPTADDVRQSAKRVGGGGTDLTKALDWIDKHVPDPSCCIVMTDGYTPFGEDRNYPTLWAMSTDVEAPWGETVRVECDQD